MHEKSRARKQKEKKTNKKRQLIERLTLKNKLIRRT